MKRTATINYDFEMWRWVAETSWGPQGTGDTPNEAIESVIFQCNKHQLWPQEEKA